MQSKPPKIYGVPSVQAVEESFVTVDNGVHLWNRGKFARSSECLDTAFYRMDAGKNFPN